MRLLLRKMCVIRAFSGFVLVSVVARYAEGFSPLKPSSNQLQRPVASTLKLQMCICIDCARVTNCAAYHFVETKHEQPHMTESPTFEPREGSPTIHVNVRTIRDNKDRQDEIERMWREHKAETQRATETRNADNEPLYGETTYDLTPETTYEYDVVKCEDFVSDPGCWVRNMPEEIRQANPIFVPS